MADSANTEERGEGRRTIPVDRRLLAAEAAGRLRERFARSGTYVLNLISAPGSGKTELLARTAERLKRDLRLAAVAGDVQTELDAGRIARAGIETRAIETHGACHLRPGDVEGAVDSLDGGGEGIDILFIENVGNLVCPSSFDLGEDGKVALVSLPEGDDKPAKYPSVFSKAVAFVITKADLAAACPADTGRMRRDARALNPSLAVFELSSVTGGGLDEWCDWLREGVRRKKGQA